MENIDRSLTNELFSYLPNTENPFSLVLIPTLMRLTQLLTSEKSKHNQRPLRIRAFYTVLGEKVDRRTLKLS